MSQRTKERRRQKLVFKTIACLFIISLCIISSVSNLSKIRQKNIQKEQYVKKLEELKEEEKILSDDVEKLKNPEYAARYAREKYLYSKNGEKIIKID